ncbi:MAG: SufE family protein [Planctomycetota bacterium]
MLEELTIEELYDEFDELPDWNDRCDLLIDLGFDLPKFPGNAKSDENLVHGCQSNVWLIGEVKPSDPPIVEIKASSDSIIVSGLLAILLALFSGKTPKEIVETDANAVFRRLGLERYLSSQRRNGLHGMVKRVRELAIAAEVNAESPNSETDR